MDRNTRSTMPCQHALAESMLREKVYQKVGPALTDTKRTSGMRSFLRKAFRHVLTKPFWKRF